MTEVLDPKALEKAVFLAISDPGYTTEGYKGDRTLTQWQTDAVMRVLAEQAAPVAVEPDEYERQEKVCFDRAMDQWRASLKRADLSDEDRVKGALAAYQRQAFAFHIRSALATPPAAQVAELERERDEFSRQLNNSIARTRAEIATRDRLAADLAEAEARATAAEAQAAKMREALAEAKKALEYSSSSLESIVALDDEDMAPDGSSIACQACVKINRRAIAKIDAIEGIKP